MKENIKTKRINITILAKQYKEIQKIIKNENRCLSLSEFIRGAIQIQLDKIEQQQTFNRMDDNLKTISYMKGDLRDVGRLANNIEQWGLKTR